MASQSGLLAAVSYLATTACDLVKCPTGLISGLNREPNGVDESEA